MELIRNGDVAAVGELLRSVTFVGEGLGCYSNFDVRDDAVEWPEERRRTFYDVAHNSAGFVDPDEPEWDEARQAELELEVKGGQSYSFKIDGFDIDVTWYWDGDGVLAYAIWEGPELVRTLLNSDCKKSNYWFDEYGGVDLVAGFSAAKALEPATTAA